MAQFNLCKQRKKLLATSGHLLVQGGPGSGKTTISLVKANEDINSGILKESQSILFLSFARSTVSRIKEHAKKIILRSNEKFIESNTYHGFAWSAINHGYLLNGKRNVTLLTPAEAAIKLSNLNDDERKSEVRRLYYMEGLLCFDLFAELLNIIINALSD